MTEKASKLNDRQELAALAVASGKPKSWIAKDLDIAEKTLYRWLQNPHFQAAVNAYREAILSEARDSIRSLLSEAVAGLQALIKDEDKNIRLKACALVLDKVPLFGKEDSAGIGPTDSNFSDFRPIPALDEVGEPESSEEADREVFLYEHQETLEALVEGDFTLKQARYFLEDPEMTKDKASALLNDEEALAAYLNTLWLQYEPETA